MWLGSSVAFVSQPIQSYRFKSVQSLQRADQTKLNLFLAPQIGFAAACAGAVFAYVYSNIDSIKEVKENFTLDGQTHETLHHFYQR